MTTTNICTALNTSTFENLTHNVRERVFITNSLLPTAMHCIESRYRNATTTIQQEGKIIQTHVNMHEHITNRAFEL